jgi:hypothetical protein
MLLSKIEVKHGLFSINPSKYESKSFQVLEIRPKIQMYLKRFLERLGIKESDSWISTLSEARSQD